MYGFLITRGIPEQETVLENPQTIVWGETRFYYYPLPKFEKDHLFYEDDEKVVLLDGVILNNHELMEKRNNQNWREVVDQLILENPATFQKNLRGSFCGAVLNKCNGELLIFTNQTGEKTVYYAQRENLFVVASHNNLLLPVLAQQGFPVEPDVEAHKQILTTGAILHGKTPFLNVQRLNAGRYVLQNDHGYAEQRYHMFHNIPEHELSLEECVEELDQRFRKAVDRIFSKNKEYGYQGACDLSGGLDGRMATWVAHDLGYRNLFNICYSQNHSIDHTVSRKIAKDLNNEYHFLALDGGDFIFDIDEMVDIFGGQVTFMVCTGAYRCMKEVEKRNIGICVTGLSAGAYEATYAPTGVHTPPGDIIFRYSKVIPYTVPEEYSCEYDNYEQMNLYEEDNLLILSSALARQQVCEVLSPYVDVEFLEFSYRIPLKWRTHRFLATKWIVERYPGAAKYVWQKTRKPVDKSHYDALYLPKIPQDMFRFVCRCINKIFRTVNLTAQISLREEMNPIDQWYRTNVRLRQFFDQYYQENITKIKDPQLQEDVRRTFLEGNPFDKVQALNVLGVYKRYF